MARVERLDDVAQLLAKRGDQALPFDPDWQSIQMPETTRQDVAAVDGSHAVLLDNGSAWVVAERAAAAFWGQAPLEPDITLHATSPDAADITVQAAYEEHGLNAPPVRSAEGFAEAMRGLHELRCARQAIKTLPSDGLLLIDGALEQLPSHAAELVHSLLEFAGRRDVIGVAKRSKLDAEGAPLVSTLYRHGDAATWQVAVPGYKMAHVARLHAQAKHAFRIDATRSGAIADLLPFCRDAVYTGYPYPLAVAHNAVAITHTQTRTMQSTLRNAVHQAGGTSHILDDFHDILDRNAPR